MQLISSQEAELQQSLQQLGLQGGEAYKLLYTTQLQLQAARDPGVVRRCLAAVRLDPMAVFREVRGHAVCVYTVAFVYCALTQWCEEQQIGQACNVRHSITKGQEACCALTQ